MTAPHPAEDILDFSFPDTPQVRPVALPEETRDALYTAVWHAAERLYTDRAPSISRLFDSREVSAVADAAGSNPRHVSYDDVADCWRMMRREFAVRFGGGS